jgi:hypothetical protein
LPIDPTGIASLEIGIFSEIRTVLKKVGWPASHQ